MVNYRDIYAKQAKAYEYLVAHEDYLGNLPRLFPDITSLEGKTVVELGAGTGRLTRILAPHVKEIHAFDESDHMLKMAKKMLKKDEVENWKVKVAPNDKIPLDDASADIVLAGWTFGHTLDWYPKTWEKRIGKMVNEMHRMLKPYGVSIIIESLTTGRETPHPPSDMHLAYYTWLEETHGYKRQSIRTDFRFETPEEASDSVRFFFGDPLSDHILEERWVIVPENTGIWVKRNSG